MRTSIGAYTHYNGTLYTIGGYITTKDPSNIDYCVSRLVLAGNIEESRIRVLYIGENEFAIIIQSDVYSLCYSAIISDCANRIRKQEEEEQEDED